MKETLFTFGLSTLLLTACLGIEQETPTEETSQKVMAPQPFYITDVWMDGPADEKYIKVDEVAASEENNEDIQYWIPPETLIYTTNFGTEVISFESTSEGTHVVDFEQLMSLFEKYPDYFATALFELEFGTVTVDGVEMTDQIISLKEIYLPPESNLFYITDVSGPGGIPLAYGITLDSLLLLSDTEGTCVNESPSEAELPVCNPNGYLIVNEIEEEEGHWADDNVSIYTTNLGAIPESTYEMSLEEFVTAFNSNKDYFTQVPFEIEFIGSPQMSPIISIKEIYIP